jgi:hypothetical protein
MGYAPGKLWVMGYERVMGFTIKIPLNRLGKWKKVWVIGEYGL